MRLWPFPLHVMVTTTKTLIDRAKEKVLSRAVANKGSIRMTKIEIEQYKRIESEVEFYRMFIPRILKTQEKMTILIENLMGLLTRPTTVIGEPV